MIDTNVLQLSQPGAFSDPFTEVLRSGARALLAQAIEAEVAALLSAHAEGLTADGRQRLGAPRIPARARDHDRSSQLSHPAISKAETGSSSLNTSSS